MPNAVDLAHQKELLSRAYVHAVAAGCGFLWCDWEMDYGIDVTLRTVCLRPYGRIPTGMGIDLQLKCSSEFTRDTNGDIRFRLTRREVDVLAVQEPSGFCRYLVLLTLPQSQDEWLQVSAEQLLMRRCAYWLGLVGQPLPQTDTVTIRFPQGQVFDVAALRRIMDYAQRGECL